MAPVWREPRSPESLFVSELPTIERIVTFIASRRRLPASDAEDFASHVKMKFVENDYAALRKFQGRSSLSTYLTVVIQRMFLDYSVAKWGRWRPSAEARRAGEVGVVLEQLLWRDGYGFEEACDVIATNYRFDVDRTELERIAGLLPPRLKRRFEDEASLVNRAADSASADALVEQSDRSRIAERVSTALKRLMARVEPQERLILVLRYTDGRSVADIATMIGIDQKRLYRHLEQLLRQLREGLEREGIAADEALGVFEDPAISVDWLEEERRRDAR